MATEKNYPLYKAMISSLLALAATQGWRVVAEKEIQHGYQIVVSNGKTQNNVDIFPSGKMLIQGQEGTLRSELLQWRDEWKHSPQKMLEIAHTQPALLEMQEASSPMVEAQATTTGKTVAEYMTDFARVAISVAGKDDYFGPLVVSAISIDAWIEAQLVMLGVLNTLSDEQTIVAAQKIREIAPFAIVTIGNKNYNEAFSKVQDKDKLLAWSYVRVIEQICEKVSCRTVIGNNFGGESILQNALTKKNHRVALQQSSDPNNLGVIAASILARAEFLQRLAQLSTKVGLPLPEGYSDPSSITVEREIQARDGQMALSDVAKLHFKTIEKVLKG